VLVHPNSEVRLSVLRLLLKNRNQSSRDRLMALAQDSRCDGQVAKAILEGVTGAAADRPSEAGSA